MDNKIKILLIGGSLRKDSFSSSILNYILELNSKSIDIKAFSKLGEIPSFNQDIEETLPLSVTELKAMIKESDAIIFVTPEYNYSIPGYLKNAIDWASRPYNDNSFNDKPAAIISISTGMLGGARAQYALRQIGVSLNIHFLNRPEIMIPKVMEKIIDSKLTDEYTKGKITELLQALTDWAQKLG